ncbi:MAG: hypothetical protein WDZ41_04295 [Candidatus Babeliales bacterium]
MLILFFMLFFSLSCFAENKENYFEKFNLKKNPANISLLSGKFTNTIGSSTQEGQLFEKCLKQLYEDAQNLKTNKVHPKYSLSKEQIAIIKQRAAELGKHYEQLAQSLHPFLSQKKEAERNQKWRHQGERSLWTIGIGVAAILAYLYGFKNGKDDF